VASHTIAIFTDQIVNSCCWFLLSVNDTSCMREPSNGLIALSCSLIQPSLHCLQTHLATTSPSNCRESRFLLLRLKGDILILRSKIHTGQRCSRVFAGLVQNRHWRLPISGFSFFCSHGFDFLCFRLFGGF
jgi:hypothetical protein